MENIIQPNDSFDFSSISLAHPTGIQGGAYFTKIYSNGKPLYVQTPKSLTKQGFVKNGKKIYADLMFDNNDEQFIQWIEDLESKCQDLIYDKKDSWFENQLEKNDIESAFTSPMRIYKSGKFYLVRVNVKVSNSTNLPNIKIYNENETPLTIDDVNFDTNIISILEVQGIRFTAKNFQIEIELKQCMTLNSDALFESCLIKPSGNNSSSHKKNLKEEKSKEVEVAVASLSVASLDESKDNMELLEKLSNEIVKEDAITEPEEPEKNEDEYEEDEEDEEPFHPPLTLGNVIKPSVQFKEPGLESELEEIEFNVNESEVEESDELREVDIATNLENVSGTVTLKKPNQVYYEIYKQARKKAKQAKKEAIMAFLEAKNIKKTYMLDDLDESDSDNSDLDNIE